MIEQLDHIAIKVTDLSSVCQALEQLGLPCTGIGQFDEVGMRIAFLGNRETHMELLEVTAETSPIVNDKPGLHHLGIKVKDIEGAYNKMRESDRYKVLGDIRQGAHSRIFFFKIKGQEEILFECVE
ncbi:MAG: methylmalonyl-CoA/ethylmalonyl-CoA epimerase [Acidobacteriota bacterium]|nr:methylmalonyl-CoA/ethylmalonyl-CoA epimerase [Acidobacteriota bacterium]